jgi:hypothetical protein
MVKKLTKLRIDEVSCVLKGANPGAKVLIRKADDDEWWCPPQRRTSKSFDEIMAKADANDDITVKTKKEQPMDIAKLVSVTEQVLMAQVNKRDDESYAKAFSRRYENDQTFREQWRDVTEAKHLISMQSTTKSMATLTPTHTEVGSSEFETDSAEAIRLLNEMATKQGLSFEQVFAHPDNRKLAMATYPKRNPDWHSAATN